MMTRMPITIRQKSPSGVFDGGGGWRYRVTVLRVPGG